MSSREWNDLNRHNEEWMFTQSGMNIKTITTHAIRSGWTPILHLWHKKVPLVENCHELWVLEPPHFVTCFALDPEMHSTELIANVAAELQCSGPHSSPRFSTNKLIWDSETYPLSSTPVSTKSSSVSFLAFFCARCLLQSRAGGSLGTYGWSYKIFSLM